MLQKQRRVKLENPLRVSPSLSVPFSPHCTSHHLDGCPFFSAVSRPSVVDQKKTVLLRSERRIEAGDDVLYAGVWA